MFFFDKMKCLVYDICMGKKYTNQQITTYLIDCLGYSEEDIEESLENGGPEYLMNDENWAELEKFYE